MNDTDPRYPLGRFVPEGELSSSRRTELIALLEDAPAEVRAAVSGLSPADWALRYRDGGWTIRQVVHHLADSHLNCTIRFRLALTEDTPAIKPYDEAAWANLPDVDITPPEVSITLLDAIHRRWVDLLRSIPEESFARQVYHPERKRTMKLDELLAIYAWHGRHHVAHIRQALARR